MKRTIYFLEYAFIRLIGLVLNLVPLSLLLRLARPISSFLFCVLGRSHRTALENLRLAFGSERSEAEIRKIAIGAFEHLAEFGIEWLAMPQIIRYSEKYLVTVHHADKVHAELREKKKGAVILVCHTGNWEIMALMAGLFLAKPVGASIYAVARPLKNPYLYAYAVKLRGGMGLKSIDKSRAVLEASARLRENAIVCIPMDQRVSEGNVTCNFFGRPALTTSLPALLALRLGSPVFYYFLYRSINCRYSVGVQGPVSIERTGNVKRDVQVSTQTFTDQIETEIRKDPRRWLWMHNRWRPRHGAKD
ncbi:MAG: lysophospholipid acyltransferase family protein [Candidatus Omnitrophica bacterium]|nr:lysophospholipid acyltransferase family protein [Candidatus Omnitrophota bacterium]